MFTFQGFENHITQLIIEKDELEAQRRRALVRMRKVCVIGVSSPIFYWLVPSLLDGSIFGAKTKVTHFTSSVIQENVFYISDYNLYLPG